MKKLIVLLLVTLFTSSFADGFMTASGGVAFPKTISNLQGKDRTAGHASFQWGKRFDHVFGIGGTFDMLFASSYEDNDIAEDTSSTVGIINIYEYSEKTSIRRRQFSLGIGAWVNFLNQSRIRPVIRGSFMPSVMAVINEYKDDNNEEIMPPSGAYWGSVATVDAEVHFMASKEVSLFVAVGYRFNSVRKRVDYEYFKFEEDNDYYYVEQPMQGLSIKFGVQAWPGRSSK